MHWRNPVLTMSRSCLRQISPREVQEPQPDTQPMPEVVHQIQMPWPDVNLYLTRSTNQPCLIVSGTETQPSLYTTILVLIIVLLPFIPAQTTYPHHHVTPPSYLPITYQIKHKMRYKKVFHCCYYIIMSLQSYREGKIVNFINSCKCWKHFFVGGGVMWYSQNGLNHFW